MPDLVHPAQTLLSGRKAVTSGGTAEPLVDSSVPCLWVIITAESDNAAPVAVGGPEVVAAAGTQEGVVLDPTLSIEPVRFDVNNLEDVWVDAATGEGVSYTAGIK